MASVVACILMPFYVAVEELKGRVRAAEDISLGMIHIIAIGTEDHCRCQ